jgi:hypothetical protein
VERGGFKLPVPGERISVFEPCPSSDFFERCSGSVEGPTPSGTESSNPPPSSGESANFRSLARCRDRMPQPMVGQLSRAMLTLSLRRATAARDLSRTSTFQTRRSSRGRCSNLTNSRDGCNRGSRRDGSSRDADRPDDGSRSDYSRSTSNAPRHRSRRLRFRVERLQVFRR